eukprot:GGOE01004043.1.p1 GENE.GGOE01004043.1~~GGOE01004043.1.p1  ORF type:complete len:407 (-),score=86.14 GGOE01004043.1:793-2013(-)
MLGFPPLVCELLIAYGSLCVFTLGQFISSVQRHRRLLSIHVGFLALCFAWGVARLCFWAGPWSLQSTGAQDLLSAVSTALYCAIYSLLALFLANLIAPLERAATPLCRTATNPRALASPSAYGSTAYFATSVPESDVAESPYMFSVLAGARPGSGAIVRDGPTYAMEERSWSHPVTRKRLNTAAYFVFNGIILLALASMFLHSCGSDAINLPVMHETLCAGVSVALTGVFAHYCVLLLRYTGTERIQWLALVAIGACAARGLWHVASLWLPQPYTEDILTLDGAQTPSLFQFLVTLLSDIPIWAVLAFFWREGVRHASTATPINQQDLPFYPASTPYGAAAFKGPDPPELIKPSVVHVSAAGPIRHNVTAHDGHWNGSISTTFDSLDAESFLPQSLTRSRVCLGST